MRHLNKIVSSFFQLLIALFCLFSVTNVMACRYIPDQRPMAERHREVSIVFEGVVVSATEEETVFKVKKVLRGSVKDYFHVEQSKSSCSIRFAVGQHWRYAGPNYMSPSELLEKQEVK